MTINFDKKLKMNANLKIINKIIIFLLKKCLSSKKIEKS